MIYLFHGVVTAHKHPVRNYTRKHIDAERFRAVLESIKDPISMDAIAAGERGTAVTFDDGFRNNLTVAVPILRMMKVPTTFYVTPDFIGKNRPSWIDRIECVVEGSEVRDKTALLNGVREFVKTTGVDQDRFAQSWGSGGQIDVELDEMLNWDDVRELAKDPLFTIGAHGKTHKILTFLDDDHLREEVIGSLTRVSEEVGYKIRHFSYPEGKTDDRVVKLLEEWGVICAPVVEEDRFRLSRLTI